MDEHGLARCEWAKNELLVRYHDQEWGVPKHDDQVLFEFLVLNGAQAGLSWETILKRREGYRDAFCGFDPEVVAEFTGNKIEELLKDKRIIRNRRKVTSAVNNAKAFLRVQADFGSFDKYIWQFVNNKTFINHWQNEQEIPAEIKEAEMVSSDLKKRGFSFVGPTICYATMQAVGLVNDHIVSCFRYDEINKMIQCA